MQALTQAVVERAIALTNLVTRQLKLEYIDNAHDRAEIFGAMLNHLVYGPEEGDTDGKVQVQAKGDNSPAV